MDTDNNGFISAEEQNQFHIRIGADERAKMGKLYVATLDKDQDGVLSFEDYAAGMYGYAV